MKTSHIRKVLFIISGVLMTVGSYTAVSMELKVGRLVVWEASLFLGSVILAAALLVPKKSPKRRVWWGLAVRGVLWPILSAVIFAGAWLLLVGLLYASVPSD